MELTDDVMTELVTADTEGRAVIADAKVVEATEAEIAEATLADCEQGIPPQELVDLFVELEGKGATPDDLAAYVKVTEADIAKHPAAKVRGASTMTPTAAEKLK